MSFATVTRTAYLPEYPLVDYFPDEARALSSASIEAARGARNGVNGEITVCHDDLRPRDTDVYVQVLFGHVVAGGSIL